MIQLFFDKSFLVNQVNNFIPLFSLIKFKKQASKCKKSNKSHSEFNKKRKSNCYISCDIVEGILLFFHFDIIINYE